VNKKDVKKGLHDGLPIGLGYLSVSFAFGIFAIEQGFAIWQALIISMTNLTSAGQLAGVTLMAAVSSFIEIGLSQLVINLRYSLMSITLSQKMDSSVTTKDRFFISIFITDEIFAAASSYDHVSRTYMKSLAILPYIGWSTGTLLGALMGNILPASIVSCLGLAIYGMFIAIIVPPAKKNKAVLGVVLTACTLSCIIKYTPLSNIISDGFAVILCSVAAAALFAWLCPIKEANDD